MHLRKSNQLIYWIIGLTPQHCCSVKGIQNVRICHRMYKIKLQLQICCWPSETFLLKAIGKCFQFKNIQLSILHFACISSDFRKQYKVHVGNRHKARNNALNRVRGEVTWFPAVQECYFQYFSYIWVLKLETKAKCCLRITGLLHPSSFPLKCFSFLTWGVCRQVALIEWFPCWQVLSPSLLQPNTRDNKPLQLIFLLGNHYLHLLGETT